MKRSVVVSVLCLAALSCKKNVPPGEAYGCIGLVNGAEVNCSELDADTTAEQRVAFATACTSDRVKRLSGRVVRHCTGDVAASCSLPAEKVTQRFTKAQASDGALQGARLGCKMRGGTFTEP